MSVGLLLTMLLTGCQTVSFSCPDPTPIPEEVQQRAAIEVRALPADSAVVEVLRATALDREKLRACRAIELAY